MEKVKLMAFLFEDWLKPTTVLQKAQQPDGEGGYNTYWADTGMMFGAAIVRDTTPQDRAAEKEGLAASFTVTMPRNVNCGFHSVIRQGDRTFRLTSEAKDKQTPDRATFQFKQASAEEWDLVE